jgi:hypothetical protein
MSTAPKDGRMVLIKVREPAGSDYAIATGNLEGWDHIAEGRWDGNRWVYYVQGEPAGWKFEQAGDEVFVRLDGSYPGFEPEETTAPNGQV